MSKQARFLGNLIIAILFLGIAISVLEFGNTKYHVIEAVAVGIVSVGFFILAFSFRGRQK